MTRLLKRFRSEDGQTLVELLIVMVLMSIGIAALVAGYSSSILANNRGRQASTAGALADRQMETYRKSSYASLPTTLQTPTTPSGPDGRTYWIQVEGGWSCVIDNTFVTGPTAPSCSGTPASRAVKAVTINVRDGSAAGKLLFTENATFDSSTG